MKFPRELMIDILKIKSWDAKKNNLKKKLKFPTNVNCYTIPYYKWTFNKSQSENCTYYKQWLYLPKNEYVIYANKRYNSGSMFEYPNPWQNI